MESHKTFKRSPIGFRILLGIVVLSLLAISCQEEKIEVLDSEKNEVNVAEPLPTPNARTLGNGITQITSGSSNEVKLYQHDPSWTHDNRFILFLSDQAGAKQIFAYDQNTGQTRQLTSHPAGMGADGSGTGDTHTALSYSKYWLYYMIRENDKIKLFKLNIGALKTGDPLPASEEFYSFQAAPIEGGGVSLDASEAHVYVGYRTRDYLKYKIDKVQIDNGARSNLITQTNPTAHVQANPYVANLMMYSNAKNKDYGVQRMRIWNNGSTWSLNVNPISRDVGHEVWVNSYTVAFNITDQEGWFNACKGGTRQSGIFEMNIHNQAMCSVGEAWSSNGGLNHVAADPSGSHRYYVGDQGIPQTGKLYRLDRSTGGINLIAFPYTNHTLSSEYKPKWLDSLGSIQRPIYRAG